MNDTKKELLVRLEKAKKYLRFHNIKDSKNTFFDTCYGAMYKAEDNRIDNLWAGKITDEEFITKLELFAKNPERILDNSQEFERFWRFVKWYMKLGGKPLTKTQIKKAYPKFKTE